MHDGLFPGWWLGSKLKQPSSMTLEQPLKLPSCHRAGSSRATRIHPKPHGLTTHMILYTSAEVDHVSARYVLGLIRVSSRRICNASIHGAQAYPNQNPGTRHLRWSWEKHGHPAALGRACTVGWKTKKSCAINQGQPTAFQGNQGQT